MAFKKILCPVDFSDWSREAMRVAIELAEPSGAPVTLVHVWQLPVYAFGDVPLPGSLSREVADQAARRLAAWKQEAEGLGPVKVSSRLLEGVPWDRIVDTLRAESSYDLAVMGTHGRTGIKRVLLGSVAEQVVRHAPCPVLVVRPRER